MTTFINSFIHYRLLQWEWEVPVVLTVHRVDDFRRKKNSEEVRNFRNGPQFRRNSVPICSGKRFFRQFRLICIFPTEFRTEKYRSDLGIDYSEAFGIVRNQPFIPKNFGIKICKIPRNSEVRKFRRQPYVPLKLNVPLNQVYNKKGLKI